uniref:Potassium voltage-gated channel subfamily H member 8-like n=1 Tax=Saccoglossus kowalevskii TaxID=10224 RepID=A0ABM0M8R0_SACKO|nr:PREDICTED: potassium voltage-gated channel subfamily H member 8-like [Saccoglossus kowalevskii]
MPARKGLLAPQNTFLDTIATRFDGTHSNFVLGNAQVANGYPIVYCSDGFCELTNYSRAEVMQKGCACKFLYGAQTDEDKKEEIENSLEHKQELKTEVMFQKKSETPFWCLLDIVPIKNEKGEVVLFLASFKDITKTKVTNMEEDKSSEAEFSDDEEEAIRQRYLRGRGGKTPNGSGKQFNYQRRRSRAVLYHLSGHLQTKQRKKRKLNLSNNLLAPTKRSTLPEYKLATVKKSRFILLHYSTFKTVWDWLILLAMFYVAIVVPYNVVFYKEKNTDSTAIYTDLIVEFLFIFDIVLNFRTTYVSESGQVVYTPRAITIHYLKSWFFIDLLAAIPLDLLYLAKINTGTGAMYLLKLVRLLRVARLLQKMERYSNYSAVVISFLMCMFALVAHWLACVWYVIGQQELQNADHATAGWIHDLVHDLNLHWPNATNVDDLYITSLYYTLSTITSVGFGNVSADTNNEKIFTIVIMLIGALMHAVIFGNVTAIIQRMYSRRALYQARERDLKDFTRSQNIPKPLKRRIMEYFMTLWSMTNGIDAHEMLRDFPEELRADICMHLHKEILSLPIFELASAGCLRSLSLHIKTSFCAPGEYLIHRGDPLNSIWYLLNGSMEVRRDGMVVAILGKGDLFGCDLSTEIDTVVQSNGDVHALTYCDLQSLNRSGLSEVLTNYPEYAAKFAQEILHDLTYNLREGYDPDREDDDIKPSSENELNGLHSHLPSISEDEEYEEDDEDEDDSDDDNSTGSPASLKREGVTRLEIPNVPYAPSTGGPSGDLSPRFVDGVEDDNNQYKNKTFDFPLTKLPTSSRNRSPVLVRARTRPGNCQQDSAVKPNCPPRQLYQGNRADSTESIAGAELKQEVEYTRNSVERLDKQVSTLSQDVASLSQDLRSVIRLLQMSTPPPVGANDPDSLSNVPKTQNTQGNNANRQSALQETSFPLRTASDGSAGSRPSLITQRSGTSTPPSVSSGSGVWQKRDAFVRRRDSHPPLKPVKSTNLDETLKNDSQDETSVTGLESDGYDDSECSGTDL